MPIRTCLVTGEKKEQSEMLRFTVQDGVLVFDHTSGQKMPGRGGYVIPNQGALERLPKLGGKIKHFLKSENITIDSSNLPALDQ